MPASFYTNEPTGGEELPAACDHEWEIADDSFDHEFGTEIVRYWQCKNCDATKPLSAGDTGNLDE